MKNEEKILIAVLVIITVIVVIFAVNRSKNSSNDNPVVNAGPVVTDGEKENLEEPDVEKYVQVGADGSKVNTSEALKANKVVNNIEFSDIQLSQRDGETLLTAVLKNTGSTANELFSVNVTLLDDAGQDIVAVEGVVPPMEAGTTKQFEVSMTLDYANAYDFKVEAKE